MKAAPVFKKGDLVIRINVPHWDAEVGGTYVVVDVEDYNKEGEHRLTLVGLAGGYSSKNFELSPVNGSPLIMELKKRRRNLRRAV